MTDRMKLLEAVAEAARSALYDAPGAHKRLSSALSHLDALPAQPQGETVEVRAAVSWNSDNKEWEVHGSSRWDGRVDAQDRYWTLVATLTARVPLPTVPTIPATVTLPLNTEGGA